VDSLGGDQPVEWVAVELWEFPAKKHNFAFKRKDGDLEKIQARRNPISWTFG
jgi:hypothetical protein